MMWLTIAMTLFQAFQQLQQGRAQAEAVEYEAMARRNEAIQREQQARAAALQGKQDAMQSRAELERVQAINSVRAGLSAGASPTFAAIEDFNEAEAEKDIEIRLFNAENESSGYRVASRMALISADAAVKKGKNAYRAGLFSALGTAGKGAYEAYQISTPSKGGGSSEWSYM